MERLTEHKYGHITRTDDVGIICSNYCDNCGNADCDYIREMIKKLAEYEDLEESGRLVKLPCAVGDTVYIIEADEENFDNFYCPKKVSEVEFGLDLLYYWGNAAFLTREAAEAKLKEIEGEHE